MVKGIFAESYEYRNAMQIKTNGRRKGDISYLPPQN